MLQSADASSKLISLSLLPRPVRFSKPDRSVKLHDFVNADAELFQSLIMLYKIHQRFEALEKLLAIACNRQVLVL